ncbi:MAG: methylornithine synthase PylB [Desulfosarcinaceae bacterium]|nr:methylornithine synthase PylB [Desulfosarcinaceae bacterium]
MDRFTSAQLNTLLAKAVQGSAPTPHDIERLLLLTDPDQVAALMQAARRVRTRHFGREVFLYGFLYASTHCRNHCRFCLYRRGNPAAPRYRKSQTEMVALATALADSGVHLIDLTMGEDPEVYAPDGKGFETLLETMDRIRTATGLPLMASVGVVPPVILEGLAERGIEWYACYQETHSISGYHRLRSGQDYDERWRSKLRAGELGMLVEEGILTGVGETPRDLVRSLMAMRTMAADQVRAMTFVPQTGTPMAGWRHRPPWSELKLIALMRLVMPDALIPASLDIDGLSGLAQRLAAGANVVTSLVPPGEGLAGVAQSELDIEAGNRSVSGIQETLATCGLQPAAAEAYLAWVRARQEMKCRAQRRDRCAC